MNEKKPSYKPIGKAIVVVGLAACSVWAFIGSEGAIGSGWAILSFLVLIFGDTE